MCLRVCLYLIDVQASTFGKEVCTVSLSYLSVIAELHGKNQTVSGLISRPSIKNIVAKTVDESADGSGAAQTLDVVDQVQAAADLQYDPGKTRTKRTKIKIFLWKIA